MSTSGRAELHVYREEAGAVSQVFYRRDVGDDFPEVLELTRLGVLAVEDIGMGADGPRTLLTLSAQLVTHHPGESAEQ